jgi:hypothetical protein
MDMTHIKLVLDQLARLHATSYYYLDHYPGGGVEKFKKDKSMYISDAWFAANSDEMKKKMNDNYVFCCEFLKRAVTEYSDDDDLTARVENFAPNVVSATNNAIRTRSEDFNCLIHNDAWCNNFMFK